MNINVLRGIIPDEPFSEIDEVIKNFNINTPLRMSHFLAQCAHESGVFRWKVENLNYSKEALMITFRKYFPTVEVASKYARNPEMIANRAYANRMNNGDEASGDGWKYRGRGYIQLTGKDNYTRFNDHVDVDVLNNPDLVAERYPLLSASWFWSSNRLNSIADQGSTEDVVKQITRRVNGGFNGLADRQKKFDMLYELLS